MITGNTTLKLNQSIRVKLACTNFNLILFTLVECVNAWTVKKHLRLKKVQIFLNVTIGSGRNCMWRCINIFLSHLGMLIRLAESRSLLAATAPQGARVIAIAPSRLLRVPLDWHTTSNMQGDGDFLLLDNYRRNFCASTYTIETFEYTWLHKSNHHFLYLLSMKY